LGPSAAADDRGQLQKHLDRLESEDVLLVTRLDRLARSTRDLLNILGPSPRKARRSAGWGTLGLTRQPLMGASC
jgi:hypothetical protein